MSVFAFLLATIACFDQYVVSCMCVNWSKSQEQTGGLKSPLKYQEYIKYACKAYCVVY